LLKWTFNFNSIELAVHRILWQRKTQQSELRDVVFILLRTQLDEIRYDGRTTMQVRTSFFILLFLVLFMLTLGTSRALAKADAGPDQTVSEGDTVVLDGSASTLPPGGIDTYQWQQTGGTPTVTLIDADTATATFTAPDVGVGGTTLTFQLTVSNTSKSSKDDMDVTVSFINQAPTANAGDDQVVDEETVVTLNGSSSFDPDPGDSITYQWEQSGGSPNVNLSGANTVQASFTAPNVLSDTTLTFQLTVTDSYGLQGTDTCSVELECFPWEMFYPAFMGKK
jgi:uncharacterized protein YndB with AHSA1/START domain